MEALRLLVLLSFVTAAVFTDSSCVIDLECEECLPEHMPLVVSHRAAGGAVRAAAGEALRLACRGGRFVAYPLREQLEATCEAGRLRVAHDLALRDLLELGCQEDMFEDVLHEVEGCGAPLQGRAYQISGGAGAAGGAARHLATLCFDADRALAVRVRATSAPHNALPLRAHREPSGPLSLLGNFNHMFDAATRAAAERLYGDAARLNRRLAELVKHEGHAFAGQTLAAARLLSPAYFDDENARVADFVSGKVAAWRSVAEGNLAHAQRDVAALLAAGRPRLRLAAGTHGVAALRPAAAAGGAPRPLFLKPGRFPVPRYIWTVVHDPQRARAAALVTLNDPFVAVSEIRAAIFCESVCSQLPWLRALTAARRYETPLYGLTFCCNIHDFTAAVGELPGDEFLDVPRGSDGLLIQV